MPFIDLLKNFRDNYMKNAAEKADFSEFPPDEKRRYRIIFSGVVQGVGFRYEVWRLAQKLSLTGFAKNLPSGDVLVEVQGPKNKIFYLIHCMDSIQRIYIENKVMDELPLKEEREFTPVY